MFKCSHCTYIIEKFTSSCPMCRKPNAFIKAKSKEVDEFIGALPSFDLDIEDDDEGPLEYQKSSVKACDIEDVTIEKKETGITSFDNATGGIIKGACNCIAGDPGVGKSTLMIQVCNVLASTRKKVLYTGHEMPLWMTKNYAKRVGPWNQFSERKFNFQYTNNIKEIVAEIEILKPTFVVVDSLQYIYDPDLDSKRGSVAQLDRCAKMLTEICKETMSCIYIICHVTKDGDIAGPMSVEHAVDALWFLEKEETYLTSGRIEFTSKGKNRFGTSRNKSIFTMNKDGLLESVL